MDLTKEQREIVGPLLPRTEKREDGKGRPRVDDLDVLDGILWILRTGAPWKDLPERYPSRATCHRRFQQWVRDGTLEQVVCALARDLEERGGIDLSECFIDGTFVSAKKGGILSVPPSVAKAPRSWPSQTLLVFLSDSTWKALPQLRSRLLKRP